MTETTAPALLPISACPAHTWDDEAMCTTCGADMFAIVSVAMRCRACGAPFSWVGGTDLEDGTALSAAGVWARAHHCPEGKPS